MNWILGVPLELRLAALFVIGVLVGGLLNLGIYRLAWQPRFISPWSRTPPNVPARGWADRIPFTGWLRLRRESTLHGRAFWIRPLLIEIGTGLVLAGLYWWEVSCRGLLLDLPAIPAALQMPAATIEAALHATFFSHCVLACLMIVVSLIDIDEKIIPDAITVPGTWWGLLVAAVYPWSLLPAAVHTTPVGMLQVEFLTIVSPHSWPAALQGFPHVWSLVIAAGCWWLWCFALMPRRWHARHGLQRAWSIFAAHLVRDRMTWLIACQGLVGTVLVGAAWWLAPPAHWAGLLTALVGMIVSGGLIWLVRVLGSLALDREAMGFGDVTLMAMIGTVVGWQPALVIFFLAPFFGLLIGIVLSILRRGQEIPYGPFLCLATILVIVRWGAIWQAISGLFEVGWLVPAMMALSMVGLVVLLGLLRAIRFLFRRLGGSQ